MKPEQQQIAIAEACGWTEIHERHVAHLDHKNWCGACRGKEGPRWLDGYSVLPDYLSDLNAMHEAEKLLTDIEHKFYRGILYGPYLNDRNMCSAPASERAEAFLKIRNLWTSS